MILSVASLTGRDDYETLEIDSSRIVYSISVIDYMVADCISEKSCSVAMSYLDQIDLSDSLQIDTNTVGNILDIIDCYIETIQYQQASDLIDTYSQLLTTRENKVLLIHSRNVINFNTNEYCKSKESRPALVKLLQKDTIDNEYLYFADMQAIFCSIKLNNYEEAIKALDSIAPLYPTRESAINHALANIYIKLGQTQRATTILEELCKDPAKVRRKYFALMSLAHLENDQNNLEQAKRRCLQIIDYSQQVELSKSIGYVYSLLAQISLSESNVDSARYYAQKGIDISIAHSDVKEERDCRLVMLEVYRTQNQYSQLLDYIPKIIDISFASNEQEDAYLKAIIESYDHFDNTEMSLMYRDRRIQLLKDLNATNLNSLGILEEQRIKESVKTEKLRNNKVSLETKSESNQKIKEAFIVIFILVILLSLTIIFFYNLINIKNKMKLKETNELNTALKLQGSELNIKNKQLQQEINSNIKLQEFANIVSHDLKSPLVKIGELIKIFKSKNLGLLNNVQYLNLIESTTVSLTQFIHSLLDFAKIKRIKMELKSTNLPNLLKKVMLKATPLGFDQSNIQYHNSPKHIYCKKILIEQLFQNLITNAVRSAVPDRPLTINISAKKEQNQWLFEVKDNGSGIEDDIIKSLMNSSYNTQLTTDNYKGHGLGFNIIMYAIESHGGQLNIKSEVGQGTVISFTINHFDNEIEHNQTNKIASQLETF